MSKPFDAHYKWKELGSEHAKNERCKQGNFYERKKNINALQRTMILRKVTN